MSFATMLINPAKQPGLPHVGSKELFISTLLLFFAGKIAQLNYLR
jgi:hypothetical protein